MSAQALSPYGKSYVSTDQKIFGVVPHKGTTQQLGIEFRISGHLWMIHKITLFRWQLALSYTSPNHEALQGDHKWQNDLGPHSRGADKFHIGQVN